MNKYVNIYKKIIREENESILDQSTELLDENELVKESLGKWAKNVFTKFGKGAIEKELTKTFDNVISKYQLTPIKQNGETNINILGKREGDYIIIINLDPAKDNFKSKQISVSVLEGDSKKPVAGLDKKIIKIKHSWTEQELTDAINNVISPARIKLTGAAGKVEDSATTNNQNNQNENTKKSFAGFNQDELKDKINNVNGNKEEKLSVLKSLVSGWKKLTPEEQKAFLQLK